jgi:hypothetical protein
MTTTRAHQVRPAMPSWTRLRTTAVTLYALLGTNIGLATVAFVAGMDQRAFYARAESRPWTLTLDQIHDQQARVDTINAIAIALIVATGIAFAVWTWLAYARISARGYEHRFGRGWAAGAWFVPILGLYRPKQIIDEIVEAGGKPSDVVALRRWTTAWWSAWVMSIVAGWLITTSAKNAKTLDAAEGAALAYMGRNVLLAVAAVLAIVTVHHITRQQRSLG